MKLTTLLIFLSLSLEAFAAWRLPRFSREDDSNESVNVVWSCPGRNRGDMPSEKEVRISYDETGSLIFRPNIFKSRSNISVQLRRLFMGRRTAEDVPECLRSFIDNIPASIATYHRLRCSNSTDTICSKRSNEILSDAKNAIKQSNFFYRHQIQSTPVGSVFTEQTANANQTQQSVVEPRVPAEVTPVVPDTTTETAPRPEVAVVEEPLPVITPVVPRNDPDQERNRAELLDYMIDNSDDIYSLRTFNQQCPNGVATSNWCRSKFNRNTRLLNNLSRMFTAVRGEPVPVTAVLQSLECAPQSVSNFQDVEDVLRGLDRKDECAPMNEVGDFKLFRKANGPPRWYTSGNYLLKKTGDNQYEATLNLDFKTAGGRFSPAQMMNTVRNCLAAANPYMRGPGGERIAIRALSPDEANRLPLAERPQPDSINIVPDQVRASDGSMVETEINSGNFHSNINCATVMHELLHHLGLCDEYLEGRTNVVSGMGRSRAQEWSCRVVPNRPSIMKNHIEAYNAAVPRQLTCQCVNSSCQNAMTSTDPRGVAARKILTTANPYTILGNLGVSSCGNAPYMVSNNITEPDKAYRNVQVSGNTLTFEHRTVFHNTNNRFDIGARNVTCTCPAGDTSCPELFARAAEFFRSNPQTEDCPLHTQKTSVEVASPTVGSTTFNANSFTLVTQPRVTSLIEPSHFDKILTGGCMTSSSALFKQCADYAYIPKESPTCNNKPAECANDDLLLGVRPE